MIIGSPFYSPHSPCRRGRFELVRVDNTERGDAHGLAITSLRNLLRPLGVERKQSYSYIRICNIYIYTFGILFPAELIHKIKWNRDFVFCLFSLSYFAHYRTISFQFYIPSFFLPQGRR